MVVSVNKNKSKEFSFFIHYLSEPHGGGVVIVLDSHLVDFFVEFISKVNHAT
jgi:hypothetical protein